MRDDFPEAVKRVLARRVNERCSNPACNMPTSGPHSDATKAVSIGEAAHITAAAPGGPRYDPTLSFEERKSASNGIWLCSGCAGLIDKDEIRFTVHILNHWKKIAEERALTLIRGSLLSDKWIIQHEHTLRGHENYVWDLLASPDGTRLFSASNDKTVRMWDAVTGNQLHVFEGHNAFVCSLAISNDGRQLAAGGFDGTVLIWDASSGNELARIPTPSGDAKVAFVGAHREQIACGYADGSLRFFDLKTHLCLQTFPLHDGAILKILIIDHGRQIISVSADATIKLSLCDSGHCKAVFRGHSGEVNSVALCPDEKTLLSASNDKSVRVWDIESQAELAQLLGHSTTVWRVAVAPSGELAASGSGDNTVRLWDLDTFACVWCHEYPDCVAAVAFSPNGQRLFVGCDNSNIYANLIEPNTAYGSRMSHPRLGPREFRRDPR